MKTYYSGSPLAQKSIGEEFSYETFFSYETYEISFFL